VTRSIQIMRLMARQLTIERAIMQTWFIEGAPHYQKPFHPSQVTDVAQHLWCDEETTLFVWTLHSSDFIKEEHEIVLRTMCKMGLRGKDWNPQMTPYQYFQSGQEMSFKRDRNWNHVPETDQRANRYTNDFNYLEMRGNSQEELISSISASTPPNQHLTKVDVTGVLAALSKRTFCPAPHGYESGLLADDMVKNHRGVRRLREIVTRETVQDVIKQIAAHMNETILEPVALRIQGLEPIRRRNRSVVLSDALFVGVTNYNLLLIYLTPDEPLTVESNLTRVAQAIDERGPVNLERVQRHLFATGMPNHITAGQVKVLEFALDRGWLLDRVRPEESHFIEIPVIREKVDFYHFASEADVPRMRADQELSVVYMEKKRICFAPMALVGLDKRVVLDAFVYASMCATTAPGKRLLGWTDPSDPTKFQTVYWDEEFIRRKCEAFDSDLPEGGVSRFEGIPFKRREYAEKNLRAFLQPTDEPKIQSNIEVIRDLNKWAATQQHLICGLGVHVPVVTRDAQYYSGPVGTVDYPKGIIDEQFYNAKKNWMPNEASRNSRHIARSF